MWTEPQLVQRAEQPYAAIRVLVTMQEIADVVPPLNAEVFGWLDRQGVEAAGPPFWKYNVIDMERQLEIEAGAPTANLLTADDRVSVGVLPAGTYATLINTGHPMTVIDATRALLAWGEEQSVRWDRSEIADGEQWGARLEFYLTDPAEQPDMTQWDTELAFRVADH